MAFNTTAAKPKSASPSGGYGSYLTGKQIPQPGPSINTPGTIGARPFAPQGNGSPLGYADYLGPTSPPAPTSATPSFTPSFGPTGPGNSMVGSMGPGTGAGGNSNPGFGAGAGPQSAQLQALVNLYLQGLIGNPNRGSVIQGAMQGIGGSNTLGFGTGQGTYGYRTSTGPSLGFPGS